MSNPDSDRRFNHETLLTLIAGLKALVVSAVPSFGAIQGSPPADADTIAWIAAEKAGRTEAFRDYLARFPTGRHSDEAFHQLLERELPRHGSKTKKIRGGRTFLARRDHQRLALRGSRNRISGENCGTGACS